MLRGSSQPLNQPMCIGRSAADCTTQMQLKFMRPPEPSDGEGRDFSALPLPSVDQPKENEVTVDASRGANIFAEGQKKKVLL